MSNRARPGEATPRRQFLRTLAVAPAAALVASGCATSSGAAGRSDAGASARPEAAGSAAAADQDKALVAIRAVPLVMDAEPAFVFRAAPARPGE
jgi:hypothetical protein